MRAVLHRFGQALVTLGGASVLIFGMLAVTPGDPARRVLEARGVPQPSPPAIAAVRGELRLDDPLVVRFARWAGGALSGDLGISWRTGRPVVEEFATRLPATLRLTAAALVLAVVLALLLGAVAASAPGAGSTSRPAGWRWRCWWCPGWCWVWWPSTCWWCGPGSGA